MSETMRNRSHRNKELIGNAIADFRRTAAAKPAAG